eukprot:SAG22_NODE_225_length_14728_cov_58.742361_9_plen_190_part_00
MQPCLPGRDQLAGTKLKPGWLGHQHASRPVLPALPVLLPNWCVPRPDDLAPVPGNSKCTHQACELLVVPLPAWVSADGLAAPILDFFAEHLATVPRSALVPEFPADRAEADRAREAQEAAEALRDVKPAAGADLCSWLPLAALVAGWSPLTIEEDVPLSDVLPAVVRGMPVWVRPAAQVTVGPTHLMLC